MKKVNEKMSVTKDKKEIATEFTKLVASRAMILGESKTSVLFVSYKKDDKNQKITFLTWLPKTIVFKSEYALTVTISIPSTWKEFTVTDTDGGEYKIDNVLEYAQTMDFKIKN